MNHLFLFTIGPVQSFIAQARKVQDLAAGSQILSDLIDKAIEFAKKEANAKRIFPASTLKSDNPNRFLAFIETDNAQKFGDSLQDYIKNLFLADAKKLFEKSKLLDEVTIEYALRQLNDFLKIYWVAMPGIDESNYTKESYGKIEQMLGGVKNLRVFEQFPETGRKCSVNGEYNVIVYRYKSFEEEKQDKEKQKKNERFPAWVKYTEPVTCIPANADNLKNLDYGEGLCAISLFKRLYKTGKESKMKKFDATCKIAYKFAIDKLDVDIQNNVVDKLQDYNEQYLYDDAEIAKEDKKDTEKINELRQKLKRALGKDLKLGKYYAVLVYDADNMGKWLSGAHYNGSDYLNFQKRLSELLGDFGIKARDIIDYHSNIRGQTIYAGGDDYIGIIPLEYLFGVLKDLRCAFKANVSEKLNDEFAVTDELSFSAGVAIAHYKTPLGFVLNQARDAEKRAKKVDGKDALAITVLKRSGEIQQTILKWFGNDNFVPDYLHKIMISLANKTSSNTWITNLTQEFLPILGDNDTQIKNMFGAEMKRLVSQTKNSIVINAAIELNDILFNVNNKLSDFIGALHIAVFLSRQINKMQPITDDSLQNITDLLVEHYKPQQIILFGSQAAGIACKDSDIDLLIVKNTDTEYRQRASEVLEILRNFDYSFDIIVLTPDEFSKRSANKYDIAGIATKEGRTLL